jgi:hypothetical protein
MSPDERIASAERELARLKEAVAKGPMSFDEWAKKNDTKGIVPIRFYDKDPGYRFYVDHRNERGFLPGEQPVCMLGSRFALIKNDPLQFVRRLHERAVRRQKKTIIYRADAYEYNLALIRRISEYLDRKKIYCHSRTLMAATQMGWIGVDNDFGKPCEYAHILLKGKIVALTNRDKILAVKDLFNVTRNLVNLAGAESRIAAGAIDA